MSVPGSVVLSTLEFDVLWEAQGLPPRHVALDVPSPGTTHTERAGFVRRALDSLAARGLLRHGRALPDLADRLCLLARPEIGLDAWVWTDREVKALLACTGSDAVLCVVDGDEVWLIPARDTSLAESAVSVAGELAGGVGRSVSLPHEVLCAADTEAAGDPRKLVTALGSRQVPLADAQELAGMLTGMCLRGQFGVECRNREQVVRRADRVVAFHDTDAGRYLYLVRPDESGRVWCTVTPADNRLLAEKVWELLAEALDHRTARSVPIPPSAGLK